MTYSVWWSLLGLNSIYHYHLFPFMCSYECLLSGLWHHCRHCFGSPCRRHPDPLLCHRLLLLLLCLVSAEDCLQEEEGRCQIHLKRPLPWSSCFDVAEWLAESICYILLVINACHSRSLRAYETVYICSMCAHMYVAIIVWMLTGAHT